MIIFSIDHGNGHVKARNAFRKLLAPSEVAPLAAIGVSIGEDESHINSRGLYTFISDQYENEVYVWGEHLREHVINPNDVRSSYTRTDRYKKKFYKVLSSFILAELASDFEEETLDVQIITGCPSRERGTEEENQLIDAYLGTHRVNRAGVNYVINVKEVKVIPQPMGTILSMYMDPKGYIKDEVYGKGYICVMDIGSGTTDISVIKSRKLLDEYSFSIPMGMNDVYHHIAHAVNSKRTSANASIQTVERQLQNGKFKGKYKISEIKTIDVKEDVELIVHTKFDYLLTKFNNFLPDLDAFDRIVLSGGGASFFEKSFKKEMPKIALPPDTQFANVEGFYRWYGLRLGVL
jgi:plasmid segregation protein ParM